MATNYQLLSQGTLVGGDPALKVAAFQNKLPSDDSEMLELLVSGAVDASNLDEETKACLSRELEVLKKAIASRAGTETADGFHQKENVPDEQIELIMREINMIRAKFQKECDEMNQLLMLHEQLRRHDLYSCALKRQLWQAQLGGDDASEDTAAQNNPPSNLLQWMALLVTDMMNVSDVDDAEDCASKALELLKTIASHEGVQTAEISRQKRSTAASASHSACSNESLHKQWLLRANKLIWIERQAKIWGRLNQMCLIPSV